MCVKTMIKVKLHKTPELKKCIFFLQFKFNQELYSYICYIFPKSSSSSCQKGSSVATSKKLLSLHFQSRCGSALKGEGKSLGSPSSTDSDYFASKWVRNVCEQWARGMEAQGKERHEDGSM